MRLTVNGSARETAEERLTVSALLAVEGVQNPQAVAVQLNGLFVNSAAFGETFLKEGDEVDYVYFMGGGGSE